MTTEVEPEPMILGDLSAAYLRAEVIDSGDEPTLRIDDGENVIIVDPAFGTVEQAILGVERLITAAREYVDLLHQSAYRRAG